jgi:hypothetical protein
VIIWLGGLDACAFTWLFGKVNFLSGGITDTFTDVLTA